MLSTYCTQGTALLLGEGDFSFSVSLKKMMNSKVLCGHILPTAYHEKEKICIHKSAASNVKWLEGQGIHVLFGVDATQIREYPTLADKKFDNIIFNFPHTGGKSNIRRNRQLILYFMQSASELLSDDNSRVMVTLCNGQGGTPADCPQRDWHNSWQLVAMAGRAGLRLVEVMPFIASEYPGYTSTGYRSQDKQFNTSEALTHIFMRGPTTRIQNHSYSPVGYIETGTCSYKCLKHVVYKINRLQTVLSANCHPLSQDIRAVRLLLRDASELTDCITKDLLLPKADFVSGGYFEICKSNERVQSVDTIAVQQTCTTDELCFVRRSMWDCVHPTQTFKSGVVYSYLGDVYRQTTIKSLHNMFGLELLVLCRKDKPAVEQVVKNITRAVSSGLSVSVTSNHCDDSIDCIHHNLTSHQIQYISVNTGSNSDTACCGTIGNASFNPDLMCALICIDRLVTIARKLEDYRLLWTKNVSLSSTNIISVPSLYPPTWVHDVSFWVNDCKLFDECQLLNVILNVAPQFCIKSVAQIDQYTCLKTHQTSLCYRIIYQSLDDVLSDTMAGEIQLQIRACLSRELGVILR